MATTLLADLGADQADPSEFDQVLLQHFHHGMQLSKKEMAYGHESGSCALKIIYEGSGLPVSAEASASLKADDIGQIAAKIRDQLLTPGPKKIGRQVLFTIVRTTGFFRYRQQFQILPVPPEAPQPEVGWGKHPFLLEVEFVSSSDPVITILRKEKKCREAELLCAALFNWPIESTGSNTHFRWVLDRPTSDPLRSVHRQELYTWPGHQPIIDAYSLTTGIPSLGQVPPQTYYVRSGYSVGDGFDLPDNFGQLLDRFSLLSYPQREQFLRASYWFQHAQNTWTESRSAAFVAFVSSVEALMPDASSSVVCDACRRPIGLGPTARFAEFVDRLVPDTSVTLANRRRFYSLRSALTHGGRLLHGDQSAWGIGITGMTEQNEMRSLVQIVRIALHNWLLAAHA